MTIMTSAMITIVTLTMFAEDRAEGAGALHDAHRGERRALERLRVVDVRLALGAVTRCG